MSDKNILLIDTRVQSYETIVSAVNQTCCIPITFDYYTDTVEDIKTRIKYEISSNYSSSTPHLTDFRRCVGLVQHNYNLPYYTLIKPSSEVSSSSNPYGISTLFNVAKDDPNLQTWSQLSDLISWCKTDQDVNAYYFDMMACAIYSNSEWKYVIDTLTTHTGVTIRASMDDTGNSSLGGNWFLESHTGINLVPLYFTEAVYEYDGVLAVKVTIYTGYNYTGSSLELNNGDYTDGWLADRGFNDNVWSIIIPNGFTVQVWQHNFWGDTLTYTSDVANVTVAGGVSSIRVTGSLVQLIAPTFTTFAVATSKTFGDVSFAITTRPTSNSNGTITYSSSNTAVATIDVSGNFITLVGAGDVSFNATQSPTTQYTSGTVTSNTLTVARGTSNLASSTFAVTSSKTILDASFVITTRPTSNSSGAITYSSSNTSVATIDASGNFITIVGLGTVTFTATQAQSSQYLSATKTSNTLTVSKAMPTLAFVSPPTTKNVTDAAFTVTASSASSGAVTYSSSNTSFATVNPSTGLVTLKGVGTVTITASQASTATYDAPTNATCSIVIASAGTALQGQIVSSSTSYASVDLSGASLAGTTVSGVSFSGANLSNVNFSGAVITNTNFTNANISGATNLPTFSTVQKLQLLKNINNVEIGAVQVSEPVTGSDINAMLSVPNETVASAVFTVKVPTTVDGSGNKVVSISSGDTSGNKSVYIPINPNENVKINNIVYSFNGTNILDTNGNSVIYTSFAGVPFRIYAGSIVAVNIEDALNKINVLGDGLYDILSSIFTLKT